MILYVRRVVQVHYSLQCAFRSQLPICCIRTQPSGRLDSGLTGRPVVPAVHAAANLPQRITKEHSGFTKTWHLRSSLHFLLTCCGSSCVTHPSLIINTGTRPQT